MLSSRYVLLVDDDDDSCVLTQRLLTRTGVSNPVVRARDATEAKGYLQSASRMGALPGVMLLDINLPGDSGFELLRWVRRDRALQALKVIMWTASPDLSCYLSSRELGAEGLLVKYAQRLGAAVRACLNNDRAAATAIFAAAARQAYVPRREILEERIADYHRVITMLEEHRAAIVTRRQHASDSMLIILRERMTTVDRTLQCLRLSLAGPEQELQRERGALPSDDGR